MAVYACRINEAKLCEREREKKYEIEVDQGWGSRTYRGKRQWPSLKDLGSIIFRLASFEAILVVIADTRRVQLASTNLLSFSRDYILPLDIEPRIHREEREREREREGEVGNWNGRGREEWKTTRWSLGVGFEKKKEEEEETELWALVPYNRPYVSPTVSLDI